MQWFNVIFIKEQEIQNCLDMIILLCNPDEKTPAHITIRGPLKSAEEASNMPKELVSSTISIFGVDNFFGLKQNTIYLRCDSPFIKRYWRKPDYPYNPHITIYDGNSWEFANQVYDVLRKHRLFFRVTVGEVSVLPSAKGQRGMNLWLNIDFSNIRPLTGVDIDIEKVRVYPEWRRLMLVDRLCTHLSWLGQNQANRLDV